MTTGKIAVIISVIFSLLFLLSQARHDPYHPDEDPSTAVAVRDSQEINRDHRTYVESSTIPDVDLSRQIAHSLRLPISRHFQRPLVIRLRRGCHHHPRRPIGGGAYARDVEIPYGHDMVGFPGERRPFPTIEADGRQISKKDVRGWKKHSEMDWEEIEHKEKKEKEEGEAVEHEKQEREEREEGGFQERFREFLNRF